MYSTTLRVYFVSLHPPVTARNWPLPQALDNFTLSRPRRYLQAITPKHFDVTGRLQRKVEELGGGVLELVAARDDLNRLFGNPLPGKKKELRLKYLVVVSPERPRCSVVDSRATNGEKGGGDIYVCRAMA